MRLFVHLKERVFLLIIGLLIAVSVSAVPKRNIPITLNQPDGTIINCFVSGDEFHNWLHDSNGYTIIQHPKTGYYVFAIEERGDLIASDIVVGTIKPENTKSLKPFLNISREKYLAKRNAKRTDNHFVDINPSKGAKGIAPLNTYADVTMNNVVIFIRFADVVPATENSTYYDNVYNASSESLKDYYTKVTYNKLSISSSFYPAPSGGNVVWYTDSQNRNYYRPYNAATNTIGYDPEAEYPSTSSQAYREHMLLKNAVDAVASSVPTGLNLDTNNDDYIDLLSFVVAGANDSWNELLWPHQWSLSTQDAYINSKKVGDYTFQVQYFYSARIDLGTICHEMFHQLGAPDLYHYDENTDHLQPVGKWDIMEQTTDIPQNMGAYMKYLYGGWISSLPEISQSGTYTLNPLATSATQNAYRIPSPNSYKEYFVVEYRKKESYDSGLPSDGMLVYRINSGYEGVGNADGPPDEVYIYRPEGTADANGIIDNATFNAALSRTSINDQTNPSSFLNNGSAGGLKISNVTNAGATVSFNVSIDFLPSVILKNDRGLASGIGGGTSAITLTAATRFNVSDLTSLVGRKITKVDFYINGSNGADVTSNEMVKIWEVNPSVNPVYTDHIYSQSVSSIAKFDQWTSHTLTQPLEIKANKEYLIGYYAEATSGYPFATDGGPIVAGKGGWVYSGGVWKQLTELNASLSYNFLIRAIIEATSTDVETLSQSTLDVEVYPNPVVDEATFKVTIPQAGTLSIDVYNMLGQRVGGVETRRYDEGSHTIPFSKKELTQGIYLYTANFICGGKHIQKTQKLIISR